MDPKQFQKAIAAAVVPLVIAVIVGLQSGQWDGAAIGIGISGLITAVVVYYVSNKPPNHPQS